LCCLSFRLWILQVVICILRAKKKAACIFVKPEEYGSGDNASGSQGNDWKEEGREFLPGSACKRMGCDNLSHWQDLHDFVE
jgi:hypothetical protein